MPCRGIWNISSAVTWSEGQSGLECGDSFAAFVSLFSAPLAHEIFLLPR
jgi:hypothetical protein